MITIKNLTKSYGNHMVLDHLNLVLPSKGLVALLGHSGSGKTTLFNMLGLLDIPNEGAIIFNGTDISKFNDQQKATYRKNYCGIIFQKYYLIDYCTVEDNVLLPLEIKNKEEDIHQYLAKLHIEHKLHEYPYHLSGGEQQRVALARVLCSNYPIILADEPTGALDSKNAELIMSILKETSTKSLVVIVTHNEDLAYRYADCIVRLENGKAAVVKTSDIGKNQIFYSDNKEQIKDKYLFKWTKNIFIHNKYRYLASILCYCLCLTAFLCVLGLKKGLEKYANDLIDRRLDFSYIDIYSIKDGYMSSLDENIQLLLDKYQDKIVNQISYDDLLSTLYIKDLNEADLYYEIKVVDDITKAYYNDVFAKELGDKLTLEGSLIVPYTSNKNAEYIDVSWDFNLEYYYEGKTYNNAKIYLPRAQVITYLKETNTPLLNEQLNEVNSVYSYIEKYINKEIYAPYEIVILDKENKEEIYQELLKLENCYPKYNTENLQGTYNLIVTGDEMIRNTFIDLLDAGGTAILLFILTLVLSVVSLITLILYYSMKKRSKEFSIIRSFGGSSVDIAKLILYESAMFSLITFILSIFVANIIRITLYNISTSLFSSPYKIDLVKIDFSHILLGIFLVIVVLLFSTTSPMLQGKKQDIVSVINDD